MDNEQYIESGLSVGTMKIANKYEIFTEEEIDAINNKIPELDERVGVIEDEIEEINSSLDNKASKNEIFSMANMGQDIKEAMTGGSVAVVGKNAILTENIVDKQVTAEKIKDIIHDASVNKVDTEKLSDGYLISSGLTGSSSYKTTDYIPVNNGDIVRFYKDEGMGGNAALMLYNSNLEHLEVLKGQVDETSTYMTVTIDIENVAYARFSFQAKNINKAMLTINCEYPSNFVNFFDNGYKFTESYKLNNAQKVEVKELLNTSTITPNMISFVNGSENLFDKDDIEIEEGKFINALGNFSNATGYNISGYIKAKANDKFIHKFTASLSGTDATFIYCDENKNKLGYASGVLSEDESTCTITVPNITSIRSIRVTFTDAQKLEFMLVSGEVYPNEYRKYGEIEFNEKVVFNDIQKSNIKDLSLKAIEETPIKPNQTDFFITSKNLFNKNDNNIQVGKFINVNGAIVSAKGYNISGFINIEEERQYIHKFNQSYFGTNATYLYYGDSDDLLGSAKANISEDGLTCILTVPAGAKKIKINFTETDRNSLMFVKGNIYPSEYEDYGLIKFDESIGLNDKQKDEVRKIGSLNPLEGKIISGSGDSIMYGAGYVGGFIKIIAEQNNMIYENLGKSGSTIASGTIVDSTGGNRGWICRRISEIRSDADYIILEGGVNDASLNVPLGEITKGYAATIDDTTFCGAFESMLKQAINRFPGKKIGFVITHRMSESFETYYPKIIEMCEKWGIPYCDLFTKCPPLNYIPYLKANHTHNGDGWHPNELGYKEYYVPKIESWIKTL